MNYEIGDCRVILPRLEAGAFQCCVTSPPYWGLRDYGHSDQLGLEATPEIYVAHLVEVFREVRRVLRDDGTLWLNLGDCYIGSGRGGVGDSSTLQGGQDGQNESRSDRVALSKRAEGLKAKDLVGIPWMVALALRADGWYLRSDIVWAKPNPMPESVSDRPTKAHEMVFLLSKSPTYFYDAAAIAERATYAKAGNTKRELATEGKRQRRGTHLGSCVPWEGETRNARSVWTIATEPYAEAHFATMPTALVKRCILAGSPSGGAILDPFFGSGTVGQVAELLGRCWFGIELNPDYAPLIDARTAQTGLAL